ncbi:MAG TPA: hypothetical protein PLR32_05670 [candidate division Zixibacteria bacterium]|nr:hypothetical protein [candidate division Zixibacteria bacterium]
MVFAALIAFGARFIGSVFHRVNAFSRWARRLTGVVFIAVGAYYAVLYIFGSR